MRAGHGHLRMEGTSVVPAMKQEGHIDVQVESEVKGVAFGDQ